MLRPDADHPEGDDEGLVHRVRLPARDAEVVDLPDDLPPGVAARLHAQDITGLWSHQAEALHRARAGEHLVIATGTASGKTLCYQLAAVDHLAQDPHAVVLYLAPTKALAHDQLRSLRTLGLPQVRAAAVDGDTPREERQAIRRTANWVLTNPDLLHHAVLPDHRSWGDLLHRLRLVVVDEAHMARGVFGGHVALVLRRLRRMAERYGADPRFLLTSATVGNPAEHASALTGLRVAAIERDGAPRGPVEVGLWQPPWRDDPGAGGVPVRRSLLRETGDLLASFVAGGVQTLVFTRSRAGAEVVAVVARDRLTAAAVDARRHAGEVLDPLGGSRPAGAALTPAAGSRPTGGMMADVTPGHSGDAADATPGRDDGDAELDQLPVEASVAAYRGGYLASDRRQLEADLRSGRLRGVAATEALELGIDVSGLDAVVLAGWPGTTASFWQRLGRAGRMGGPAVGVLVAQEDPLDQYLVAHPDVLFGRPPEDAIVDPANPYLLGPHLRCACQEQPLTSEEAVRWFGPDAPELLATDADAGRLRERGGRWFWLSRRSAAGEVDLRAAGGATIRIVDGDSGVVLGDIDEARGHRQVHTGAIHLHRGTPYRVTELDLERGWAIVTDATGTTETTRARTDTHVRVLDEVAAADRGEVPVRFGRVEVVTQVTGYEILRLGSDEVLDRVPLDLPPLPLLTTAVWYALPEPLLAATGLLPPQLPGALHAAEHAAIGMLPLLALCDRWDLGGLSTDLHADTGLPTVFIYDGVPGGAGLAERSFHRFEAHVRMTRDAIASCACATGCPACVQSPKCGNGNEPLDKSGALAVLGLLLAQPGPAAGGSDAEVAGPAPAEARQIPPVPDAG